MSTTDRDVVIRADGLRKAYGATVAVDSVSFEVAEGEIFGLIGPNGAGKTTSMECIEGLRSPDAGSIRVLSYDPRREARHLQARIGVQLQEAQLQKRIKVWEAVRFCASLYPHPVPAEPLLERLGLEGKRDSWFMDLSGGQKQRLFIALALVNDPEVVFLDELTTGLDPQARRRIWELVSDIRSQGKTVLLTTHLMEEAERLCDRVAIIDHGRVVDIGAPADLVSRHCPERSIVLRTEPPLRAERLADIPGLSAIEGDSTELILRGSGEQLVSAVIGRLSEESVRVVDLRTLQPNLEDVFLRLTGHSLRD